MNNFERFDLLRRTATKNGITVEVYAKSQENVEFYFIIFNCTGTIYDSSKEDLFFSEDEEALKQGQVKAEKYI